MKYTVDVLGTYCYSVKVVANSDEEAEEKAIEIFEKADLGDLEIFGYPDEVYLYDENGGEL